jgi:hypothetical protein
VQGREDEQGGRAIQRDQGLVADIAGEDQFIRAQAVGARMALELFALVVGQAAGDEQLVPGAHRRRQQAPGADEAEQVLARIAAARRAHHERAGEGEALAQWGQGCFVYPGRHEALVDGRGNGHHVPGREAERADRLLARIVGNGQQPSGALERIDLAHVGGQLRGRAEVGVGIEQGDQVVQDDGGARAVDEAADRADGVVDIALEQAGDEHHVGFEQGDELLADHLGGAAAGRHAGVHFGDAAGRVEHADALLRHQAREVGAHRRDGFLECAVEHQPYLVIAAVAQDAARQRGGVAADAAKAAGRGLRTLEVDHDAHVSVSRPRSGVSVRGRWRGWRATGP